MADWSVTTEQGGYTVRRDRSRNEPCEDLDAALHLIRRDFKPGDKVVLVEADGYKTVITRQVSRKSWRK